MVEDRRQQGAQHVGAGQGRGLLEQFHHSALLVPLQRTPCPAQQGPSFGGGHGPLGGPLGVAPATFRLAQLVDRLAVLDRDMGIFD